MTEPATTTHLRQPSKFDWWVLDHPSVAYAVGGLLIVGAFVIGVATRVAGVDGPASYIGVGLAALGGVIAIWPWNVKRLIRYDEIAESLSESDSEPSSSPD